MATYECDKCGMAVNITCAKCNAELKSSELELDDGKKIAIAECPNNCGKIIAPQCCMVDMTCKVGG